MQSLSVVLPYKFPREVSALVKVSKGEECSSRVRCAGPELRCLRTQRASLGLRGPVVGSCRWTAGEDAWLVELINGVSSIWRGRWIVEFGEVRDSGLLVCAWGSSLHPPPPPAVHPTDRQASRRETDLL